METLCENKCNVASGKGKEMGGREKRRRKTKAPHEELCHSGQGVQMICVSHSEIPPPLI